MIHSKVLSDIDILCVGNSADMSKSFVNTLVCVRPGHPASSENELPQIRVVLIDNVRKVAANNARWERPQLSDV